MLYEKWGGPAYPTPISQVVMHGMSLRDWFAGMALSGLMSDNTIPLKGGVRLSYEAADEMLKERVKDAVPINAPAE